MTNFHTVCVRGDAAGVLLWPGAVWCPPKTSLFLRVCMFERDEGWALLWMTQLSAYQVNIIYFFCFLASSQSWATEHAYQSQHRAQQRMSHQHLQVQVLAGHQWPHQHTEERKQYGEWRGGKKSFTRPTAFLCRSLMRGSIRASGISKT